MECGNIRNRNNNGSDYEEVFKKRESRYRTDLERIKIVSLSKDKQDKPLIKDLSPKKAKNAWLYDDVEDADSDASESNGRVRKSGKEKENNHLKENAAAEKKNVSMAMAEKQCESNLNEKVMILMNNKKQKGKGVTPVKTTNQKWNLLCQDGAIKVVYTKKDEMRSHVVSVRGKFVKFQVDYQTLFQLTIKVPLISMTVMLLGNNIYFISLCGTLSQSRERIQHYPPSYKFNMHVSSKLPCTPP
uniref:Uncharacterized protein n=1 Tax=Wuchereria bancrofti TaxID=6293 RepID=A0A1I8EKX7_WUCBA